MLKRIKQTFITLGLASGMTAIALFKLTGVDHCRVVVLSDLQTHREFVASLTQYTDSQDFLTALTKGK